MESLVTHFPQIMYGIFCFLSIFFAIGVVMSRNPVSSAFSLIAVLLNVAAIFAMQEAHFVAAVQVLVYAGAIMVLFVFVIMLLNIDQVGLDMVTNKISIALSAVGALVFCILVTFVLKRGGVAPTPGAYTVEAIQTAGGNIRVISEVMFSDYVLPFEIVAVLLLMAIVGAVVLAKRKVD